MRVLIAGCGYVGRSLARMLVSDGHEVFGLRRTPRELPHGVVPVTADLAEGRDLEAIPGDLDACVSAISPDGRSQSAYKAAYVRAVRNLQPLLENESPHLQRWVFTSSTAVYGQKSGEAVDERTSTSPSSFTGRTLVRAEGIVRASPVPSPIVIRFGGIYGPGRTRLLDTVRRGEATCPPNPSYTNRIHRDDAAGAIRHLLAVRDPAQVYLGVDTEPAERCEVLTWMADQLGAPPPSPGPPSSRGSKRVDSRRLQKSGFEFRFPTFREGYRAILDGQT